MIWIIVAFAFVGVIVAIAASLWEVWRDRKREEYYNSLLEDHDGWSEPMPIQPAVGEFAYPGWTVLKWYEQADGLDDPVYIALHQVVGIYPSDVGTEDETLAVHLPNGSHVFTSHPDTIRRFWDAMEII